MIKTVLFFTIFGISLILSGVGIIVHYFLGLFSQSLQAKHMKWLTKNWARFIIFTTGNRVKVINREVVPNETVLYVVNHQSYFDIPVCMVHLPEFAPFIAKAELEKAPILSFWMKQMGCFFLDRKDMRQSLKIILSSIEVLKEGQSLVIFPEGTRAKDGVMADFKPGSLKLAVKAGVPIVPVTLSNTYKVFEETNRVRKADVSITFHDPIDTTKLEREEINVLHKTVRDTILSTLER